MSFGPILYLFFSLLAVPVVSQAQVARNIAQKTLSPQVVQGEAKVSSHAPNIATLDLADFARKPIAAFDSQWPKKGDELTQLQRLFSELIRHEQRIGVLAEHRSRVYLHPKVTQRSALVLSGLYESPKFNSGVARALHEQGYNVIALRLSGHGTNRIRDLKSLNYRSWLEDLELGLKLALLLGEKIIVVGHSTGGTLTAIAGCNYAKYVDRLVFLAPALQLRYDAQRGVALANYLHLESDWLCANPYVPYPGCLFLHLIDPVLTLQLKENLPLVPKTGIEVVGLIHYAQNNCGRKYQRVRVPALMISTEGDDVTNHRYNSEVAFVNNWPGVMFTADSGVDHVNLPKSAADEFDRDRRTQNPHFAYMRDKIVDFVQR